MEAATAVKPPAVVPRLKERYEREIRPMLVERFEYGSPMQAPRLVKIVLNMGVGEAKTESKQLEAATEQLATIAGQRPNERQARRSIAGFKIRDGMPIGVAVTLRDARMWEFLDRLISISLPRVRDFRGLSPRSFDGRGNYALGVREQIIFPEIDYDAIDQVRGLDVAMTTTADTDLEAFALLEALGMPFTREGRPGGEATDSASDEEEERRKGEARQRVEAEQEAYAELREEDPEAYAGPDADEPTAPGEEAASGETTDTDTEEGSS